ncbi:rCG20151, partial [Rattus norvegicus]
MRGADHLKSWEHYDFGMRTLKTVLIMTEKKKLEHKCTVGEHLSELEESLIIIEAIQEASMSKFLPEDVLPFERIIEDVFPGITVSKTQHLALEVMRPRKQYQVPWRWNLCGF